MDIILPKIVSIGIYNSSVAVKNRAVTKNRKTAMFEIEIPIEKGGISYINSEQMPILPNVIICAKPGQIRHTKLPFKCYYVHIIVSEGELFNTLMDIPNYIKADNYKKYYEIFEKMYKKFNTSIESDEIILHSLILELIYLLTKDSKKLLFRDKVKNNNFKVIEKSIKYVKDNIASDLSLNAVADFAGFSPIHFHNCFKASTGKTLREYVEEQRIKKAANMLVATDRTLTEIAYECGFSSQSYFSYVFKQKTNLTPREYAKNIFKRYDETIEKG